MIMEHFYKVSLSCLSMNRHPYVDQRWSFSVSGMPLSGSTFAFGKAVVLDKLSHGQVICSCSKPQLRVYVCFMQTNWNKAGGNEAYTEVS